LKEVNLERLKLKKELSTFLILTFAATIFFFLLAYLILGPLSFPVSRLWFVSLQSYMLIPALAAITCMIAFKSKVLTLETKIVFTFFLIYTGFFAFENYLHPLLGTISLPLVALQPTSNTDLPVVSTSIAFMGILTVFILHLKKNWRENLEAARLSLGKNLKYYLIISLVLAGLLIFSYILNYISGLGVPSKEFNLQLFFKTLVSSLILSFFILWPIYFGEEYGWRVYLQDRLFPLLGGYKGVFLIGVIWGLWHIPLILLGAIYPGQPLLGIVLMLLNCIILGIVFSYAVLVTGSVWIAVILHLVSDTIFPIGGLYIATSTNPIFSFGTGLYGFAIVALFALIILKSKIWKMDVLNRP
jgi:uncharacterized protein